MNDTRAGEQIATMVEEKEDAPATRTETHEDAVHIAAPAVHVALLLIVLAPMLTTVEANLNIITTASLTVFAGAYRSVRPVAKVGLLHLTGSGLCWEPLRCCEGIFVSTRTVEIYTDILRRPTQYDICPR